MRQKTAALFTVLFILLFAQAPAAAAPSPDFTLHTASMLLVDLNSGETVYSRNADEARPMASLTKIMTYIVTAEAVADLEGAMMEILDEPLDEVRNRGASMAGLERHIGESMPVLDVLYALMLPSGCDAGAELAHFVGGGDRQSFVDRMNEKAAELGCANTHYADSHGLSDENVTTARDLYKIVTYAMRLPYFWEVVNTTHHTLPNSSVPMFTSVRIQDPVNGGRYYYRYAHGVKTGYTSEAGRCLISTAAKGDAAYLCVALGGEYTYSGEAGWTNYAMLDTASLYRWAFANFTRTIEVDIPQRFASVGLGDTLALAANVVSNNTEEEARITWSSSAPEIAGVDENGVVTAYALGQVTITAQTQTGDFDACTVSSGFYNGIDVSSDSGDYTGGTKEPVNWSAVKSSGLDYAVIRAGWSGEDCQSDESFGRNTAEAARYGVPFGVRYTSRAASADQARAEAEFLLGKLEGLSPALPVVYDMSDAGFREFTAERNTEIALAFRRVMAAHGYETACFGDRSLYALMDLNALAGEGMELWYRWWPYVAEFDGFTTVGNEAAIPQAWQYRSDLYVPEASQAYRAQAGVIYMASALAAEYEPPALSAGVSGDGQSALLQWTAEDHLFSGFVVYRQAADSGVVERVARLAPSARSYRTYGSGKEYIYTVAGLVEDALYPDRAAETVSDGVPVLFSPPTEEQVLAGKSGRLLKLTGGALLALTGGALAGIGYLNKTLSR